APGRRGRDRQARGEGFGRDHSERLARAGMDKDSRLAHRRRDRVAWEREVERHVRLDAERLDEAMPARLVGRRAGRADEPEAERRAGRMELGERMQERFDALAGLARANVEQLVRIA